jgi:hypothetical protein
MYCVVVFIVVCLAVVVLSVFRVVDGVVSSQYVVVDALSLSSFSCQDKPSVVLPVVVGVVGVRVVLFESVAIMAVVTASVVDAAMAVVEAMVAVVTAVMLAAVVVLVTVVLAAVVSNVVVLVVVVLVVVVVVVLVVVVSVVVVLESCNLRLSRPEPAPPSCERRRRRSLRMVTSASVGTTLSNSAL